MTDHNSIRQDYERIKALPPQERLDVADSLFEKVFQEQIMIDVGVGNVQTYTAIRLLEDYNQTYSASDPLALKHYNHDYVALVSDLGDRQSPTTVKFAGLMVKEAVSWGETHVSNWKELSQGEKEGFASFYYNVGQDYMNIRYNKAIENSRTADFPGEYNVDIPNTDIAQEFILNKANIVEAENPTDLSIQAYQGLIANDQYTEGNLSLIRLNGDDSSDTMDAESDDGVSDAGATHAEAVMRAMDELGVSEAYEGEITEIAGADGVPSALIVKKDVKVTQDDGTVTTLDAFIDDLQAGVKAVAEVAASLYGDEMDSSDYDKLAAA